MTNNFNEYMIEMLLEAVSHDEAMLMLSVRFKQYLKGIDHPIAKMILAKEANPFLLVKKTFIDLDDDGVDTISFITSSKAAQLIITTKGKDDSFVIPGGMYRDINNGIGGVDVYSKNRSVMKINKLVNQIFPNEFKPSGAPGEDMESFVNLFKSGRDTSNFEVVDGEDIIHWYKEEQHAMGISHSVLGKSCMRHDECSEYLEFYAENKGNVSLVILKDNEDETKVRGRAILWKLKSPANRMYMDRIYQSDEFIVDLFKKYAKENGWLYKSKQTMDEEEPIVDSVTGEIKEMTLEVQMDNYTDSYPYMDTMKYYDPTYKLLSNTADKMDESRYYLEQDNGEWFSDTDKIYYEYYNEYIHDDEGIVFCELGEDYRKGEDAVWSKFYHEYMTKEYIKEQMVFCKYGSEYRKKEDAVYLEEYDEYTTTEYLDSKFSIFDYSDHLERHIKKTDSVFSDYHQELLRKSDAIEVFIEPDRSKTDWRMSDQRLSYYKYNGEYYDHDIEKSDIK